jgi:hypothetical protein
MRRREGGGKVDYVEGRMMMMMIHTAKNALGYEREEEG